jgi:hypothetical protein
MNFKLIVISFAIAFIIWQVFKCVEAKAQQTEMPKYRAEATLDIKARIIIKCPLYGYVWDNSCNGLTVSQCCDIKDQQEPPTTFTDGLGETWILEGDVE